MHRLTSTSLWNLQQPKNTDAPDTSSANPEDQTGDAELHVHVSESDINACYESVNPEMTLDEHDPEGWEDMESNASETGCGNGNNNSENDCGDMYQ